MMKNGYFKAEPKFYENEEGVLGVFALTEGVKTILPEIPDYEVDGKNDILWNLFLVSMTKQSPLGVAPYKQAIEYIKKIHGTKVKDGQVYIQELDLELLERLLIQCKN